MFPRAVLSLGVIQHERLHPGQLRSRRDDWTDTHDVNRSSSTIFWLIMQLEVPGV